MQFGVTMLLCGFLTVSSLLVDGFLALLPFLQCIHMRLHVQAIQACTSSVTRYQCGALQEQLLTLKMVA